MYMAGKYNLQNEMGKVFVAFFLYTYIVKVNLYLVGISLGIVQSTLIGVTQSQQKKQQVVAVKTAKLKESKLIFHKILRVHQKFL